MGAWLAGIRNTVGRKLSSLILGPILIGILMAINAVLPADSQLTPEQVKSVAEWIISTVLGFIAVQGTVDMTKAIKSQKPTTTPPIPSDTECALTETSTTSNSPFSGPMEQM